MFVWYECKFNTLSLEAMSNAFYNGIDVKERDGLFYVMFPKFYKHFQFKAKKALQLLANIYPFGLYTLILYIVFGLCDTCGLCVCVFFRLQMTRRYP